MKKILSFALLCAVLTQTTFCQAKEHVVHDTVLTESTVTKTIGNAVDSTTKAVKDGVHLADTSTNFKMMYNDVKNGIAGLASALKVGAEHVYIVLTKQQVVIAISDLVLLFILFGISWILYRLSRKTYEAHLKQCGYKDIPNDETANNVKYNNSNIDLEDSAKGVVSVVLASLSGIVLIFFLISLCINYTEIITGLINPEYGAMKDIVNFVKK